MNKKSANLNNLSVVVSLIEKFKSSPTQAYQELISRKILFSRNPRLKKKEEDFWIYFGQIDIKSLIQTFPSEKWVFEKMAGLYHFFLADRSYDDAIEQATKNLLALQPSKRTAIKTLYLALELGWVATKPENRHNYLVEVSEALKRLLKNILPDLDSKFEGGYSLDLFNKTKHLLGLQMDYEALQDMLDMFLWSNFKIEKSKTSKNLILRLSNEKDKQSNLFILNDLKNLVKRSYKSRESQEQISREKHFVENDPIWKSEGLLTVIHNENCIVKEQTPGTVSMQVKNDFFEELNSSDSEKRSRAQLKWIELQMDQYFHHCFRHALAEVYQPNDEVDIHSLQVDFGNNIYVSLYDVFCVMSSIISYGKQLNYMSQLSGTHVDIMKGIFFAKKNWKPGDTLEAQLLTEFVISIANYFPEFEEKVSYTPVIVLEKQPLLRALKKVEELKDKSDSELLLIIDTLSSIESRLPYSPIYKIDNQYCLSLQICDDFVNRMIYDHFISDKLYNSDTRFGEKKDQRRIFDNQKSREFRFTNSIKELFQKLTPYVDSQIDYANPKTGYDFGDLRGEFDVLAYFEKEKLLVPIQVKLSNVSPLSEKRKFQWIQERIIHNNKNNSATEQLTKDVKLLRIKKGLEFVSDKLGCKIEAEGLSIHPLIITDNFFCDHKKFDYYDAGTKKVTCVSYFELKHLILNLKVHDVQVDWKIVEPASVQYLFDLIEDNHFWSFLAASKFRLTKTLQANDNLGYRITLIA